MSRKAGIALVVVAALVAGTLYLLSDPSGVEVRRHVTGDMEDVVGALSEAELPVRARSFLATNRPWRAARAMDRYLEEADDVSPSMRVLAARAHGGWGDWGSALSLLEDVEGLDPHDDGVGLWLLGRGRDAVGQDSLAIEAYRAFLAFSPPGGELEAERGAARLRLALALIRTGDRTAGRAALDSLALGDSPWLTILEADALAAAGDTAGVREAVAGLNEGISGLRARRARVAAARAAGDLAGARALANAARRWASTEDTRSEFLLLAGDMAREMGDESAARDAFRTVIESRPGGAHARGAATRLREGGSDGGGGGELSPEDALAVARVEVAQGLHEEALDGFEAWLDEGGHRAGERADVVMEYATALFYAERYREAIRALEPIDGQRRARLLIARAEAHRGRAEDAAEIYLDVARSSAGTGMGAYALFVAAGTYHDEGEVGRARELYREVVERYPGTSRMGLALMRLAGMAFEEGDFDEAARIWRRYRTRFPRGDRALQARYWEGRALAEAGDSASARELFREVRAEDRTSYYALVASQRLGEPFWPVPMSESPPADAAAARQVATWMRELDLLRAAGFDRAASAHADRLVGRVGGDRQRRFALAEALAERGYSQGAIRLAISLGSDGDPSRRLLQIRYPFPYRTLITEESRDRGLDPFVIAALIRQESMFEARITSPAGARGLMQIMPATGQRLAEAAGMEEWTAELLYHPEINVHLGTRYVAQHMEDYDGSLPSVFSAYNAGPHRVEWWSEFPEYREDELFTERIPYSETRDYVKILTRNRALYEGLYGGE